MLIFVSTVLIIVILFFVLTMPYNFRLERKINRVSSFEEVSVIENNDFDFSYIKDKVTDELNIEDKFFESTNVDEIMRYIVVTNKNYDSKKLPTLILLHGLEDCADDWIDRANLLKNYLILLERKDISPMNFVLLDSGYYGSSWYSNFQLIQKKNYEEFFVKELIPTLEKDYGKVSGIAGFSMGGYAAYKIGIKNLDKFKVLGSFSGAISLIRMMVNRRIIRIFKFLYIPKFVFKNNKKRNFVDIFGSWCYKILREDPYSLIKKMDRSLFDENYFYLSVGREDFRNYLMLQQWLDMITRFKKHKFKFKGNLCLRESHTWEYVSRDLKNFLIYYDKIINKVGNNEEKN